MRVHYRHGTADRRLLKGASIGLGTVLAVALVIWPPVEIWRHVLAWVLAATAVLGGLLSLLMRPRRHLLITEAAVILHPDGPRRVVPLMQIHHVEVIGSAARPGPGQGVVIQLRNGERIDISHLIGRRARLAPLFEHLGVRVQRVLGS